MCSEKILIYRFAQKSYYCHVFLSCVYFGIQSVVEEDEASQELKEKKMRERLGSFTYLMDGWMDGFKNFTLDRWMDWCFKHDSHLLFIVSVPLFYGIAHRVQSLSKVYFSMCISQRFAIKKRRSLFLSFS